MTLFKLQDGRMINLDHVVEMIPNAINKRAQIYLTNGHTLHITEDEYGQLLNFLGWDWTK